MPGAPTKRRTELNDRQALFVQLCGSGKSYTDAFTLAGYKPNDGNATHLAQRLASHIAIEREKYLTTQEITLEYWRRELSYQYTRVRNSDPANALRALEDMGKHIGALDPQQPIHPQAQALIAALAEGLARSRNTEAPKLPEAKDAPIHGAYQVLEKHEGSKPRGN